MAEGILLEAGTNEMELLVFSVGGTKFGINVAKVRELVSRMETINPPNLPFAVEGHIKLREKILSLVNLGKRFQMEGGEVKEGRGLIIIIEFNNQQFGMLVDSVDRIHRLNWDQIIPPSSFLSKNSVPMTGSVLIDNDTIIIADVESIFAGIFGDAVVDTNPAVKNEDLAHTEARLLLAEDSMTIRTILKKHLHQFGFENIDIYENGQLAWNAIAKDMKAGELTFDVVVTDIEMPQMDGFHLCRKIKNEPKLSHIPVIIYSSIVSPDNEKKGQTVGADAQITKFHSSNLAKTIEECLDKYAMEKKTS